MVRCVICGLVLLYKNRGIGSVSVRNIGEHYVNIHNMDADRMALKDYLHYLVAGNEADFIPLNCICSEIFYLTPKALAIHQLQDGFDL